jgi:hypothetical protein
VKLEKGNFNGGRWGSSLFNDDVRSFLVGYHIRREGASLISVIHGKSACVLALGYRASLATLHRAPW